MLCRPQSRNKKPANSQLFNIDDYFYYSGWNNYAVNTNKNIWHLNFYNQKLEYLKMIKSFVTIYNIAKDETQQNGKLLKFQLFLLEELY